MPLFVFEDHLDIDILLTPMIFSNSAVMASNEVAWPFRKTSIFDVIGISDVTATGSPQKPSAFS